MTDDILERLLREIAAGQREILAAIRALPPRASRPDDAATARAIASACGGRPFIAKELLERAKLTDAEGRSLRAAIGSKNSRQIGNLLRRLEGVEFDGLSIHRVRRIGGVLSWVVKGV